VSPSRAELDAFLAAGAADVGFPVTF
jgi:hypothetical protein